MNSMMWWAAALASLGVMVQVIGTVIHFRERRAARHEAGELDAIRTYIERLDLSKPEKSDGPVNDLPFAPGLTFGETEQMMRDATDDANRRNRQLALDKADEFRAAGEKRERVMRLSWVLLIAGGILQTIAAWLPLAEAT